MALLPEEMIFLHVDDFYHDATYAPNLEKLVRQLAERPAPLGKLIGVPGLSAHSRAGARRAPGEVLANLAIFCSSYHSSVRVAVLEDLVPAP